jgi:hypothetical protein
MFKFFRPKKPVLSSPSKMFFKTCAGFFEYHCKYMTITLKENHAAVALVLDAQKEYGADSPISIGKNGCQLAALRVAARDGGFVVFAETPSSVGEGLQPGDAVLWVPRVYSAEVGSHMQDRRSGWIGLIRAKVNPVIDLVDPSFDVACRYD